MTSTVIVKAHCPANVEVHVLIVDTTNLPASGLEKIVLQNEESVERSVYDNKEISVREVRKPT